MQPLAVTDPVIVYVPADSPLRLGEVFVDEKPKGLLVQEYVTTPPAGTSDTDGLILVVAP